VYAAFQAAWRPEWSPRCGRTVRTGHGAERTTVSATLPSKARERPPVGAHHDQVAAEVACGLVDGVAGVAGLEHDLADGAAVAARVREHVQGALVVGEHGVDHRAGERDTELGHAHRGDADDVEEVDGGAELGRELARVIECLLGSLAEVRRDQDVLRQHGDPPTA
jgi:hypothetical protein